MIQYYNPHFTFSTIFKSLFEKNAEQKIIDHFKEYTGKNFILVTGSCRQALYLSYISAGIENKNVATSPLTCFSAIQPILLAHNKIEFIDIELSSLNMDLTHLDEEVLGKIDAVQFIHHGGIPIDYLKRKEEIKTKGVLIIEDCAQAYGAKYQGKNVGSEADIACYSLIKNLYGISGGILATDSEQIYIAAKKYLQEYKQVDLKLIYFRLLRNLFETYRRNIFINSLYHLLMKLRPQSDNNYSIKADENNYVRSTKFVIKLNSVQLKKEKKINDKIKSEIIHTAHLLQKNEIISNNHFDDNCSFTKFFIFNENISTSEFIKKFESIGIELKHLENKYGSNYQKRFDKLMQFKESFTFRNCSVYYKVHDSIVALPTSVPSNYLNKYYLCLEKHLL